MLIFIHKKLHPVHIALMCLVALLLLLSGCVKNNTPISVENTSAPITATSKPELSAKTAPTNTPAPTAAPAPIQIIIGGTGDIMCHQLMLDDAKRTARDFDEVDYYFDHMFRYITPALEYPDLMIGNLETVFASVEEEYTGYKYFNSPDTLAQSLKTAGFDVVTTANNHCVDRKALGITRTISTLDRYSIHHTGTFDSPESASTPLIIDVNGVKVGILASTYAVQRGYSLTDFEASYMLSIVSPEYLLNSVERLKQAGAQIIVASMHWGKEKEYETTDEQEMYANLLVRAGVNIIFGHHPHILQPIEYLEVQMDDGTTNTAVVCWSLGNFIANQYTDRTKEGAICYVYLSYDTITQNVTIDKCEVLPTYIYNNSTYYYDYHVLPSGTSAVAMNITDFTYPAGFSSFLAKRASGTLSAVTDSYAVPALEVPSR